MAQHLALLSLLVRDYDEALAFYVGKMGFSVVEDSDRVGFAYRTLPGHPVDGEEAFVVHRDTVDGDITLTVRSLTRAAPQQPWRAIHPLLRIAQRVARRRYLRALR